MMDDLLFYRIIAEKKYKQLFDEFIENFFESIVADYDVPKNKHRDLRDAMTDYLSNVDNKTIKRSISNCKRRRAVTKKRIKNGVTYGRM